jgi:hypothetical protein
MPLKFSSDNLSILLSSDWFFPHWAACGLFVNVSAKKGLQTECREIVRSTMNGESLYWNVDFSDSREGVVKARLESLFVKLRLSPSDRSLLLQYMDCDESSGALGRYESLLLSLCSLFVSEHARGEGLPAEFSEEVVRLVQLVSDKSSAEGLLIAASKKIISEWDKWLMSLTPDIPSFMCDTARSLARISTWESKFSAVLGGYLTDSDRGKFNEWLVVMARELAGIDIPQYLLPTSRVS